MSESLNLKEIVSIFRRHLVLIVFTVLIMGGIAACISFYFITPKYEAQTQILINQKDGSENMYSRSVIESELQLIRTYYDILKTPLVLDKVIEKLDLKMDAEQLAEKIDLYSENGSKVVFIEVLHENPKLAVDIANTTATVFKEEVPLLMKIDNINILSVAKVDSNPKPVSPNYVVYVLAGTVMGLAIGCGVSFLIEVFDSTIKSERELEELLDIPIMGLVGAIPLEREKKFVFNAERMRRSQRFGLEK